jgi:hypothetical protein
MKNPNPNRTKLSLDASLNTCTLERKVSIPNDGFCFKYSHIETILNDVIVNYTGIMEGLDIRFDDESQTFILSGKCTLRDCREVARRVDCMDDVIYELIMSHKINNVEKFIHNAYNLEVYVSFNESENSYTAVIYLTVEDIPFNTYAALEDILVNNALRFAGDMHLLTALESITLAYHRRFDTFDNMEGLMEETFKAILLDKDLLKSLIEHAIRFNLNLD